MAKNSMIARNKRRIERSARSFKPRLDLKKDIKNPDLGFEEKLMVVGKLDQRKRDESHIRVRTRCVCCGRPRAVYRKFGLCRLCLRKLAMRGDVPGLVKSSW